MKFVDQQRAAQGPDGSYDLKESHAFAYKALSKELYVGQVYLRVYNDQPDFEISEPEAFCVALIEFISYLVRNEPAADSNISSKGDHPGSPPEEHEFGGDRTDEPVESEPATESSSGSDGQVMEKEELVLVKNLRFGLTSLQVGSFYRLIPSNNVLF